MMNKKIFAIVTPIAAFTALVGTGFSAWYFGGSVGANNGFGTQGVNGGSANVEIATEINAADVTVAVSGLSTDEDDKVTTKLWLDDAAEANPYHSAEDIYLSPVEYYKAEDKENFKAELPSFTFGLAEGSLSVLLDYSIIYSVTLSENLAEYISATYTSEITPTSGVAVTPSVTFAYLEGKKPTTHEELKAMQTALADATISFSIAVNSK